MAHAAAGADGFHEQGAALGDGSEELQLTRHMPLSLFAIN